MPILSLSRTFDQEISRTSSTSRPSAAVKPRSTATIKAAASHSGMKPMRNRSRSSQQLRGGDHRLGDLGDLAILVHRRFAQQRIGVLFRDLLHLHENALGPVDHLALIERGLGLFELDLQAREGVEARD